MRFGGFSLGLTFLLSLAGPVMASGLDQAISYYRKGSYRQAADLLAAAAAKTPNDAAVRLWLGKAHLRARNWDEAVKALEAAVGIDPDSSEIHHWLGRAYGEKASRASFFRAPGWAGKLRSEFETAVRISPDNLDARFDLLDYYLQAPGFLGGGKEKAEGQAREIAARSPRLGHTARSIVHRNRKDWDLARQALEQSVREFPDEADAHTDLADYLLDRGDFSGAEASARKAMAIRSNLPRARMVLAAALVQLRKSLGEAVTMLKELTEGPLGDDDPGFADVHYHLGQAYLAQGRPPEARAALQTALQFDPEHKQAKTALSQIR